MKAKTKEGAELIESILHKTLYSLFDKGLLMSEIEKEREEALLTKYSRYLNILDDEHRATFMNFSEKQKEIALRIVDEYYTTAYKSSRILTVEDVKDDVEWLYKTLSYDLPKDIYINPSFSATKDAIERYYSNYTEQKLTFDGYLGLLWQPELANVLVFIELGIFKDKILERYTRFLLKGIFELVLFKDACFITLCPKIKTDDRGRLHSLTEPAVQWLDHRDDLYLIHGVRIESKELFDKIVNRKLTAKEIISLPNVELRSIAIQLYGYEELLKQLDATIIDQKTITQKTPHNKTVTYVLYQIQLNDDFDRGSRERPRPAKIIKVIDASTDRSFFIRVRPDVKTVEEAVASTYRLRPEEYWNALEYET